MTDDNRLVDSAGQPWAGRHFEKTSFADDDGSAPAGLRDALIRFRAGESSVVDVVTALRGTRLLVPMLAVLGEAAEGPHGRLVEKSADLAIVTVAARDGRRVLPAFTSVSAMSAWNPKARPVPVEAERVALAAASEDTDLVILDPTSETEHGLRRSSLRALATGTSFLPCWGDPAVIDAVTAATADEEAVRAVRLSPADPRAALDGPELVVALELVPGMDAKRLREVIARIGERWSASEIIADRVDGLTVKLVSAS